MLTCNVKLSRSLRVFVLTLAIILTLGSVACTSEGAPADTDADTESASAPTDTATEAPTEAETDPLVITYAVTAVDENGAPLGGVTVELYQNGTCLATEITDENGTASFTRAPSDDYEIRVSKEGYTAEDQYVFAAGSVALTAALQKILPPAATQFTVSNVFSNDMVLQRNEHVRIWGWADESQNGLRVSAEFLGTVAHTVIENGEWLLTFEKEWEANANMGNTLTVYGEGVSYAFENVLVGDVYMAIGQSNIEYNMATHLANTAKKYHGDLNENALIRLHFNSQTQTEGYPAWGTTEVCREIVSDSRWELPTEENYLRFSALGYYFAYNLLIANENTVPIGIIEVEAAGKHLACFLSNEVADAVNANPDLPNADTFNQKKGIYQADGVNGTEASRFMYNQFIYPFEKYAIAGMIWYQGESDLHDANTRSYASKFIPLMEQMRSTHNVLNKEYPIYIMEFPTCYEANWKFGEVRAVLGQVATQLLPNCYVSASSDLLSARGRDVLHPEIKWQQAKRVAAIAAAVQYGQGNMDEAMGPVLVSMTLSEDKKTAVLTFEHVGEGLKTIDGATEVKGFTLYKSGYVPANLPLKATITAPNQITVTSTRAITGIGYNTAVTNFFGKKRDLNLCNSFDVPALATYIYPEN